MHLLLVCASETKRHSEISAWLVCVAAKLCFSMAGRNNWQREEEQKHDKKRRCQSLDFPSRSDGFLEGNSTSSSFFFFSFLEQPQSAGSEVSLPTAQLHSCAICVRERLQSQRFASLNPEVNSTSGTER